MHRHPRSPAGSTDHVVQLPTKASFTDDFFAGPSVPPRPRPLYQVVLFSITTNLLWYGYYKYCIEEELRRETGKGLGGFLTLTPFVVGICAPFYIASGDTARLVMLAALGWIVTMQYWLYQRVNALAREKLEVRPLTPWWVVVPGFNLVVGLRAIHFLSIVWGANADDDILVEWFPFLGVPDLNILQFLTTPGLWLKVFSPK